MNRAASVLCLLLSALTLRAAPPQESAAVDRSNSAQTEAAAPWPAAVPGFVAPAANEHPRLFFRKADLPALRARAKTPEGQAIIARLKVLLGGGEAMPTSFNDQARLRKEAGLPDRHLKYLARGGLRISVSAHGREKLRAAWTREF